MAQISYTIVGESGFNVATGEVYIKPGRCIASIVAGICDNVNPLWAYVWISGLIDGDYLPAFYISNSRHSKVARLN